MTLQYITSPKLTISLSFIAFLELLWRLLEQKRCGNTKYFFLVKIVAIFKTDAQVLYTTLPE